MIVPSYATAMVSNYRRQANIPATIADEDIFKAMQKVEPWLIDEEEDQNYFLRQELGLEE